MECSCWKTKSKLECHEFNTRKGTHNRLQGENYLVTKIIKGFKFEVKC